MDALGIYIHIPFCVKKCSYCDFNAYAGADALVQPVVDALVKDIGQTPDRGRPVPTIFFGGGTPTFIGSDQLGSTLNAVRNQFRVADNAEISAEANPTTVDASKFAAMFDFGINRLSIGVQALDDRLLPLLDRNHSRAEAEQAVALARDAGFRNVSIDLMFGLPTQTRADWDSTLDRALALGTEHVSVYGLTLEAGTRFERLHAGGKLPLPHEDDELWMYERAIERLTDAGFDHYEVSNFARPGYRCRHNEIYWRNEEYAGFGPGAVSYIGGRRWTKEKHPSRYVGKMRKGDDLTVEEERLNPVAALSETLLTGLRQLDGIPVGPLRARFGIDPLEQFAPAIERLSRAGRLIVEDDRMRLTHQGLLFANDVFVELLPE
jgi:oxygen-independent coproporphyrinogen III oxidase